MCSRPENGFSPQKKKNIATETNRYHTFSHDSKRSLPAAEVIPNQLRKPNIGIRPNMEDSRSLTS